MTTIKRFIRRLYSPRHDRTPEGSVNVRRSEEAWWFEQQRAQRLGRQR